ncbi:CDGSH iron-sulfur domain-containing protein 1-like [Acanthaster planci]|uniref:CDGSH iron-sulfur domain-containing protein 1-like n=1 Tax=Acanthaster planci TaxID=133434 RepID=A0A8B8A146_ACAPL|nr:CDGSH iron-sulfur domain-containing protein 1-like [Acanthaster planci]
MTISGQDWLTVIPTAGAIGLVVYLAVSKFQSCSSSKDTIVNRSIKKDVEKVVDSFDIEDLGDSTAFCRCWRSKKFPYCDGSHNSHNKETGDNVGPLCLSKKSGSS